MNIYLNSGTHFGYQNSNRSEYNSFSNLNNYVQDVNQSTSSGQKAMKSDELRTQLRTLFSTSDKQDTNPYAVKTDDIVNSLYGSNTDDSSEDDKLMNEYKYNYKEVTTKINQAKNSVSAGQAVLAAKRKVSEIRRKIVNHSGDAKELQLALTHAKRIEMVARKKKIHIENEELIERTMKRDKNEEDSEQFISDMKTSVLDKCENDITHAQDEIFDERAELFDETVEQYEDAKSLDEEELASLNEMVAEFGEEIMEELEDTLEMIESMEIIDPHMDEQSYHDLKLKHRNSEDRDIVKADTEYIKDMMKIVQTPLLDYSI